MRNHPSKATIVPALVPVLVSGAVVALLSSASRASTQAQELDIIPVQGNIYMLQTAAAGGNMAVLPGVDGALLVDDQVPALGESVVRAVRAVTEAPIRFVVNTHIHIDHIGGNEVMADLGATLVAHANVRARMFRELRIPRGGGRFMPQPSIRARQVVTFQEAVTFHMNGEDVRVFHVPAAHTDGDSFVYFTGSDVLHTGDVFRTNMYPIIDVYNGGTVAGMIEALRIAIAVSGPETKIIPGHGSGFTDRDGLAEVLAMLVDVRERITDMIAQGMRLDEVLAAQPTAEYDERWGQEPSWTATDLVPIIYNEAGGASPTIPSN